MHLDLIVATKSRGREPQWERSSLANYAYQEVPVGTPVY